MQVTGRQDGECPGRATYLGYVRGRGYEAF